MPSYTALCVQEEDINPEEAHLLGMKTMTALFSVVKRISKTAGLRLIPEDVEGVVRETLEATKFEEDRVGGDITDQDPETESSNDEPSTDGGRSPSSDSHSGDDETVVVEDVDGVVSRKGVGKDDGGEGDAASEHGEGDVLAFEEPNHDSTPHNSGNPGNGVAGGGDDVGAGAKNGEGNGSTDQVAHEQEETVQTENPEGEDSKMNGSPGELNGENDAEGNDGGVGDVEGQASHRSESHGDEETAKTEVSGESGKEDEIDVGNGDDLSGEGGDHQVDKAAEGIGGSDGGGTGEDESDEEFFDSHEHEV